MSSSQLSVFLLSWRGFLLESRRQWHAHHRPTVVGTRGGYLLAAPYEHAHQLTRVARLVNVLFQRGGTVWGFGLVQRPQRYQWGRLYAAWRPGVLSNYFFVRIRRVHFARRVVAAVRVRYQRVRQARSSGLATRWGRLRRAGNLPVALYAPGRQRRAALLYGYARVLGSFSRAATATLSSPQSGWQVTTSWGASPRVAWLRVSYFRRWWRIAQQMNRVLSTNTAVSWFPSVGVAGVAEKKVRSFFAHVVARRLRHRTQRLTLITATRRAAKRWTKLTLPTYSAPTTYPLGRRVLIPRVVARHSMWPSSFPAGVVAGGFTLVGSNLVHEVNSAGVPLLHFGSSSFISTATVWLVTWNQHPRSLHGVKYLLLSLWGVAYRTGLLRLLWRRLTLVCD